MHCLHIHLQRVKEALISKTKKNARRLSCTLLLVSFYISYMIVQSILTAVFVSLLQRVSEAHSQIDSLRWQLCQALWHHFQFLILVIVTEFKFEFAQHQNDSKFGL